MFEQFELELLAEALKFRLIHGGFNRHGEGVGTPAHKGALNELADKVVSLQEAKQDED